MDSKKSTVNLLIDRFIFFLFITLFIAIIVFSFFGRTTAQENDDPPTEPAETSTPTLTPTATATASITVTLTVSPTLTPTPTPQLQPGNFLHLPVIFDSRPNKMPPPILISQDPPIDFAAAREDAQNRGLDISFNKIGFHIGVGGNRAGLEDAIEELDAAGVPIFLKTANDAELLYKTQELAKVSGVPHILVYRDARREYDTPNYDLDPKVAAKYWWGLNRDAFPPELDPDYVWIETVNELDKERAAWIAQFSLETAKLANADGFKYAALSWTNGEPELDDWESPEMLEFLRYAGEHPDQVAISLHEYSGRSEDVGYLYPWFIGRFQKLFAICDEYDIPRPTVLITEWGWEAFNVPEPDAAMKDIEWASRLYAAYPEVKGAAIWYLGPGFQSIADQAQKLIAPVRDFSLSNYYLIHPGPWPIDESILAPDP